MPAAIPYPQVIFQIRLRTRPAFEAALTVGGNASGLFPAKKTIEKTVDKQMGAVLTIAFASMNLRMREGR